MGVEGGGARANTSTVYRHGKALHKKAEMDTARKTSETSIKNISQKCRQGIIPCNNNNMHVVSREFTDAGRYQDSAWSSIRTQHNESHASVHNHTYYIIT